MDAQLIQIKVKRIKDNDHYQGFKSVLHRKEGNEERAREIILDNRGVLSMDQIKDILYIVDEPYTREVRGDGKPWYGRLIAINAKRLFKEDIVKINKWVDFIFDCVM